MPIDTADSEAPPKPINWSATSGFDTITLQGDLSPAEDFKAFKIYGSTAASSNLIFLAEVAANIFVRRPPAGDLITRYKVSAIDFSGNESAKTDYITVSPVSAVGPNTPATPNGLTLTTSLTADDKAKLVATWDANSEANLSYYDVSLKEGSGNFVSFQTNGDRYEWSVLPGVQYTVKIRAVNNMGRFSGYTAEKSISAAKDTIPPAAPTGVKLTEGFVEFWLEWIANTEDDLSFYEIIEKTTNTPPGAGASPSWASISNAFVRTGLSEGQTRFYWVRAVDTSGNKSKWSTVVSGTTKGLDATAEAPDTPTNLVLSSQLLGDGSATIEATWSNAAGAVSYEVGVTRPGATESVIGIGDTAYEFAAPAGVQYSIRVRAVNSLGGKSLWTAIESITAARDTTPPATPTGFKITAGVDLLWLEWNANTEGDLSHYEVYEAETASPAPAAGTSASHLTAATMFTRTGLGEDVTRHYWLRAVDSSGNKSGWSNRVEATTAVRPGVSTEDLQGVIDETSFAAGIEPISLITDELPTEKVTSTIYFNGKLYYWDGDAYVLKVSASDVQGELVAEQIASDQINTGHLAAAAVKTEQLDTAAVTAAKIAIGDFNNLIPNGDLFFGDTGDWTTDEGVFSIIPREDGPASSPTPYVYRAPNNGLTNKTSTNVSFTVTPGEQLYIAFQHICLSASADVTFKAQLRFKDANGVDVGFVEAVATNKSNIEWELAEESAEVPAGAASCYMVQLHKEGTGFGYLADLKAYRKNAGLLVVDGGIQAHHLSTEELITLTAQIKDAIINDAKISDLSAAKLKAGTALAGSITVSGKALSDTTEKANNPASVINQAETQIDPGKVTISGTVTLEDWRGNTDQTSIDGGKIEANSIYVRSLTVGDFSNLAFGGDFEDPNQTPFPLGGAYSITNTNQYAGTGALTIDGSVNTTVAFYNLMEVVEGEVIRIECIARRNTAFDPIGQTCKIRVLDQNNAFVGDLRLGGDTLTTSFAEYSTEITVPADVTRLKFQMFKTSGTTGYAWVDNLSIRKMTKGKMVVDGEITAEKLSSGEIITKTAQIKDAIVTDAKISDLSAAKLKAGTAIAGSITVNGAALSDTTEKAKNPANVINQAETQIDPGKVTISGETTLADWRMGGDETRIDGGEISANSIRTNSLQIGARNLTLSGIQFEHNAPGHNQVSWTNGAIRYVNDDGNSATASLTSGSATWTNGVLYIYWTKDATSLSTTTSQSTALGPNNVILATYQGGTKLDADYGRTIIDGSNLKTGTVTTKTLNTDDFAASGIGVFGGTIQAEKTDSDTGRPIWLLDQQGFELNGQFVGTANLMANAVTRPAYIRADQAVFIRPDDDPRYTVLAELVVDRMRGYATQFWLSCRMQPDGPAVPTTLYIQILGEGIAGGTMPATLGWEVYSQAFTWMPAFSGGTDGPARYWVQARWQSSANNTTGAKIDNLHFSALQVLR